MADYWARCLADIQDVLKVETMVNLTAVDWMIGLMDGWIVRVH